MPTRRSDNKSKMTGPGVVAFLILLAIAMLYNTLTENKGDTSGSTTQPRPNLPVITISSGQEVTPDVQEQGVTPLAGGAGDGITVWFSDPLSGASSGGPENNLITAMDGANKTIDIAIYNLSLENVRDALLKAKKRGVKVRLAMESEAMDKKVPQSLADAKIPIVGDQREGLMHNKFTIIDGKEVWMGSMNYTSTSAYKDFNNLVRFRNPQIVADYQSEFDEMFTGKKFGTDKEANTPNPKISINGVPVEVYFSPEDGVSEHVVAELLKAKKSIYFLAYSFTSDDFAEAINKRAGAGVAVRGVFDESQNVSNKGGEYVAFQKAGYDVKIDGIPGLLHDKVFIIDGQVVVTGSYNFSQNAEKTNDENLVIIHDAGIASQYLQHFKQVYDSSH